MDSSGGQAVPVLLLGSGISAGALVGWIMGPGRGPILLTWVVSRAALVVLAALLVASLASPGALALAARASLAAALGFLRGGLTQMLATAWSAEDVRAGGRQGRAFALASLLCLSLWALALTLFAIPLLAPG